MCQIPPTDLNHITSCGVSISRSHRSGNLILPSYLKRRRPGEARGVKCSKAIQVWDRDIICLPREPDMCTILAFPHGKYCTKLGKSGLIGKIRLTLSMGISEVEEEVHIPRPNGWEE